MRPIASFGGPFTGRAGGSVRALPRPGSGPDPRQDGFDCCRRKGGDQCARETIHGRLQRQKRRCHHGLLRSGKGLFVFDATPPREYPNWDAYKKDWEGLFAAFPGPVSQTMSEEGIVVAGSVAYGHNIQTGYFTDKAGTRTNLAVRVGDV